jgi:hypothetical protein
MRNIIPETRVGSALNAAREVAAAFVHAG